MVSTVASPVRRVERTRRDPGSVSPSSPDPPPSVTCSRNSSLLRSSRHRFPSASKLTELPSSANRMVRNGSRSGSTRCPVARDNASANRPWSNAAVFRPVAASTT